MAEEIGGKQQPPHKLNLKKYAYHYNKLKSFD